MFLPVISVILPVYNSAGYLSQAIDSLLNQTFPNFELLIINDGSTDGTEKIIQLYTDSRIIYIENESNKGLIDTLNKGIELAKGKYIARMDADDICLPERFQKQFDLLEANSSTAVVGCHVSFINENGAVTGDWKTDLQTVTYPAIKQKMIWENCVAHPTVMMRADIIKKYPYHQNQRNIEDYDLWLRLLADGIRIEKVPEKLLLYRVHEASVTGSILRKTNPFFKKYNCKRRFLSGRISNFKWGWFETKVVLTAIHDGIMGIGKNFKGNIKC